MAMSDKIASLTDHAVQANSLKTVQVVLSDMKTFQKEAGEWLQGLGQYPDYITSCPDYMNQKANRDKITVLEHALKGISRQVPKWEAEVKKF